MIAAWEGNLPMMELFVSRGADINRTNKVGEPAILHAAWKGRLDAVKWLGFRWGTDHEGDGDEALACRHPFQPDARDR